ncbi:MAG: hypothetical protein ACOH5I_12245 [Oligoflexus sp.]
MKQKNHFIKLSLWVFAIGLIISQLACQPMGIKKARSLDVADLDQILARGRTIQRHEQYVQHELSLSASSGPVFQMHRDPLTDELRWILFDTSLMASIPDDKLQSFIEKWAYENGEDLQLPALDSFVYNAPQKRLLRDDLLSFSFTQQIDGWRVKDAYIDFIFVKQKDRTWRLREINSQATQLPVSQEQPLVEASELLAFLNWPQATITDSERLWCPVQGQLVVCMQFVVTHQGDSYTFTMDAENFSMIDGYRHRMAMQGQVLGHVFERNYLEERAIAQPLPLTNVHSDGQIHTSTADGFIEENLDPSHVSLIGPRAQVFHGQNKQPETVAVRRNKYGSWELQDQGKLPAINAFSATQKINRFVRQFLSADEVDYLEKSIEVRVNAEGECNAFYTTGLSKITLYGEGGSCANLALINDVIYHEWGHGLNEHTGRQFGVADGAFSEGISDLTSAFFTGDPEIGRGFIIGSHSGIRSVKNQRSYPHDVGDVHREGGIIAGVFWDLRDALREQHGKTAGQHIAANLFFRHLLSSDTYHDSYQSVLRLDDDDGNPATRSPHFCMINRIFAARGLAESVSCEDAPPQSYQKTKVDDDLFLAFAEPQDGQLGLVASSAFADRLSICFGDRYACLSQSRTHFHFSSLVSAASERRFFVLEDHLPLKGLDLVTIIAKNSRGQVLGSRMVKLVEK